MNATPITSGINRYGARNTTKPVNFYCVAPAAASVVLVGAFNNWDEDSHPMQNNWSHFPESLNAAIFDLIAGVAAGVGLGRCE